MTDQLDPAIELLYAAARKRSGRALKGRSFGYSDSDLDSSDAAMGRPMPAPIRRFYQRVDPDLWELAGADPEEAGLLPLEKAAWASAENGWAGAITGYDPEVTGSWRDAHYFAFVHLCFGDAILLCPDAPGGLAEAVILADHEAQNPVVVLGESLAAWLIRFVNFGCREYAYSSGALGELPSRRQIEFLAEHRRLNPGLEWAHRKLAALEHPKGHPMGYFHFDTSLSTLVPLAETMGLRRIHIKSPSVADVRSLQHAADCEELTLTDGHVRDLSTIARLANLKRLYLYDLSMLDLSPLVGAKSLQRLQILRSRVRGLSALRSIGSLEYLELGGVITRGADLDELRRARPEISIHVYDQA